MRKLMDSLDMTGNEIINVSMQRITSLPSDNLFTGRIVYLESESEETPSGYYYYNGEEWVSIGSGEGGGSNNTIDHTKINVIENEFEVNKFDTISDARTYIKSKEGDSGDVYGTGFIIIIGNDTGLTSIDNYAFDGCFSIKSVYIPKSITSIGNFAFRNNITLKYVNMNHGITSIGEGAFYSCASIINIDIPNSVNSIGEGAFAYCTGLTSVNITRGSLKSAAFSYCTGLTSVIIGGDVIVTNNDYSIFSGCTSLQNVYLKNGYTYIGGNMFRDCTSLQNIYIPDSVKTIDTAAFSNCTSLTNITIPEGVKTFGYSILSSCTSLRKVTIPSTVTTIPDNPVSYCTNLEILEWKTTSIPNSGGLFYNYTKLRYVEISASSILVNMFCNCTSLTTVKINNSVKTIGTTAFSGCTSLTNITIPSGVTSIDVSAFSGCTSLTNIIIPSGVTSIGAAAFADCTGLTSVTISNSVTRIDNGAFADCTSLKSITIPSSVTRIDNGAFNGCTSLTNVSIPGRFINTNLFKIIPSRIDYLTVTSDSNSGNTSFPAIFKDNAYIKNIVINSDSGILNIADTAFQNCTSLTSITISNSVTRIGDAAFADCTSLTSITIPNSVTSIGNGAFDGCISLTNITIPNNVTSIGYSAFQDCTSLKNVRINANTTNIKSGTFNGCTALKSVSIGSYITTIESSAFGDCTSLKSITIPNNVTTISPAAFSNSSLESIAIDNTDNINIAGNAFTGLNLLSYVNIKGNATLGSNVFAGCSNLKNVYINNITEIGNGMFAGCNNLSYISMKKVTTIRGGAFSGCTSLKSITIPNTVTSIDSVAFTGCDIMSLEPYKERSGYPWGATSIPIQNEDVTTTIDENSTDRQVPTAKAIYNFIRPIFGIRYGFRINKNNSDPDTRVEYLYDAVGMTPAKMTYDETTHKGTFDYGSWGNVWFIKNNRPVKLNFNGTVEAELNPNNYWETVDGQDSELETSTNCNFMSEIPIVYVKRWEDENYNYVVVCDKQYDEDYLAYANTDKDGNLKPLYAPMFKGYKDSNNILRSIAGVDPMNNTTTSNEVMYSNNINTSGSVTGWQIEDVAKHELISDLLTLISKNTDSQTVFGNGVCQISTRVFTGYNEVVNDTKTVKSDCGQFCGYNNNVHHVNIFHIQDFWGNRFDRYLGLITSGGKYYYKMTPENGGYVYSETITDYTNNGYNIAQDYSSNDITPPAIGYIKNQSTGIFGNLPNATGASDSTYYCDYHYYNSSGVRLLILGGSYSSGRTCGSRYFLVDSAPSLANANIGASPFYV